MDNNKKNESATTTTAEQKNNLGYLLQQQQQDSDKKQQQAIVDKESCGEYILIDIIGKGGFGVVYKSLHKTKGHFAAIKKIRITKKKKKNEQNDSQSSLMVEINLLKVLQHHNIVQYYDHIPTNSHSYIIMEFIENGSLEKMIKRHGLLPESLVNTPYWMAPEVITMQGISTACDVWSLGCTIIELLTGTPPYFGLAPAAALYKIVQEDHPPIPQGISGALKDFLLQCFKKDENMRSSARQLLSHPWIKSIQLKNSENQVIKNARMEILSYNAQLQEASVVHQNQQQQNDPTRPRSGKAGPIPIPANNNSSNANIGAGISGSQSPRGASPRGSTLKNSLQQSDPTKQQPHLQQQQSKEKINSLLSKYSEKDSDSDMDIGTGLSSLKLGGGSRLLGNKQFKPKLNKFMEREDDDVNFDDFIVPDGSTTTKLINVKNDKKEWNDEFVNFSDDEDDDKSSESGSGLNLVGGGNNNKSNNNNNNKIKKDGNNQNTDMKLKVKEFSEEWDSEIEDTFDSIALTESTNQRTLNIHDKYKEQVTKTIVDLISMVVPSQSEDILVKTVDKLTDLFQTYPDERRLLISNGEGGVYFRLPIISILEILESPNNPPVLCLLKLINQAIHRDRDVQETICLMNGIPIITNFANKQYPELVREEVSRFVLQLCSFSTSSLNMFIAGSRGCKVLVDLLDSDYFNGFTLIHNSLDSISLIFKMNTASPKTALCHLFAKTPLMYRITLLLSQIFNPADSDTPQQADRKQKIRYPSLSKSSSVQQLSKDQFDKVIAYSVKAADILLFFSTGDSLVKEEMSQDSVLKYIVNILEEIYTWRQIAKDIRSFLLRILKVIKNLSMDPNIRSKLDNAGVIPCLIHYLTSHPGIEKITEIYNQVLHSLYYLLLLDKQRQDKALKSGILNPLLNIINERGPLKELALPILFDFVRSSTHRNILWECNTIDKLLDLIEDRNWFADAIESIATWASHEPTLVYEKLIVEKSSPSSTMSISLKLISILHSSHIKHPSFQKSLLPLLQLINGSMALLVLLLKVGLVRSVIECLKLDSSPVSKITLLKIVGSIVVFLKQQQQNNNNQSFIDIEQKQTLSQTLQEITEKDESEIVKKISISLLSDLNNLK
eukprot:gene3287-4117_t